MSFDPQDAEAIRRRRAEAETLRAAKDGAATKPGLLARWRSRRYWRAAEEKGSLSAQDRAALQSMREQRQSGEARTDQSYINPDRQFKDH
jgi:hypothetical protein